MPNVNRTINERIATHKGWRQHSCGECAHEWWQMPDGGVDYNQIDPPDYTHDWALAGELLEEMARADTRPTVFYCDNFKWSCNWSILEKDGKYYEHGGSSRGLYTPQEAIARAWLIWKGLK